MVSSRASSSIGRTVAFVLAVSFGSQLHAQFSIDLFHNNDGESKLLPITRSGNPYAGVDRFVSVLDRERAAAPSGNLLTLSSGDNFLAGAQFNASLASGPAGSRTFYDARAINEIGYNAIALGNHDFDFGPDVLAEFIGQVNSGATYLSANLDFSAEPALQALVNAGRIKKSTVVTYGTEKVGLIGAVTPTLASISSPRNVIITDVKTAVQGEIDALTAQGVNKIVLISHLQNINAELALIPQLSGIDIVVAGGGDELLAKSINPLIPGDTAQGAYPRSAVNLNGSTVPVVTTAGEYKYVGALRATFDNAGNLTDFGGPTTPGGAIRVSGNAAHADSVAPDASTFANVVQPVQAYVSSLAANVIATTDVPLNGLRGSASGSNVQAGIRSQETNFGNLFADALLWQGKQLATQFDVDVPLVALQNGGGIRNNSVLSGNITELNTFEAAAFENFVTIVEDVPVTQFKQILEHSIANVGGGQFGQWSGLRFSYDPRAQAQVTSTASGSVGQVLVEGNRIRDVWVTLASGAELQIIDNGQITDFSFTIDLASIDFLVRTNGDAYPFSGLTQTNLGVSYQQALFNFLSVGLNGVVSGAQYPVIGLDNVLTIEANRRIDAIPEPVSLTTLMAGLTLLSRRRRSTQRVA
jgi:5'-nucleotidase / UDP-sugar diphosphatase